MYISKEADISLFYMQGVIRKTQSCTTTDHEWQ